MSMDGAECIQVSLELCLLTPSQLQTKATYISNYVFVFICTHSITIITID